MLPGPIFRREWRAGSRGRGPFVARVMVVLLIVALPAEVGLIVMFGPPGNPAIARSVEVEPGEWMRWGAAIAFLLTIGVETFIPPLLAAGAVAVTIVEEREKETLPLLLLTRLTRLELAATKLAGRLVTPMLTLLTGLPLLVLGGWIADLPPLVVAGSLAAVASTTAVAGALGLLASSHRDRSNLAIVEAAALTMIWLVFLPIAARAPWGSGTIASSEPLLALRHLMGWLSMSSPVSLLTDPSWFGGLGADSAFRLSDRIGTMLAMQAALVAMAIAGAVLGLRRREPRPTATAPAHDFRPAVGDDPIYWREYELPIRGRRLPWVVLLARQWLGLLRTLLVTALQVVLVAALLAIPVGLTIAAGWYGYLAFREAWGPAASLTFAARDQLNKLIRFVTMMLGMGLVSGGGSGLVMQVAIERDKKTWDLLLLTPMTGTELLGSKIRASARGAWILGRWLIPLWLLGIVCGAVHPIGAALAGLGLLTGARLGLALGVRTAIRPGTSTQTLRSISGPMVLGLMALGFLTVVVPLFSARDLERLRPFPPWLPASALIGVAVAMEVQSRRIIRRCFDRFDEWVGRPHRPAPADAEAPRTLAAAAVD